MNLRGTRRKFTMVMLREFRRRFIDRSRCERRAVMENDIELGMRGVVSGVAVFSDFGGVHAYRVVSSGK
jgi:hypothetical protein